MSTRKARADNNGADNPKKKQRVGGCDEHDGVAVASLDTISFESLHNDCVVHILSYLSYEDMNTFAECSRECHELRGHESLDQTRSGTIVCTTRTTAQSFFNKIRERRETSVFSGNRTRLKIVGLAR